MAKYYVQSGEQRAVVTAQTPAEAAQILLRITNRKQCETDGQLYLGPSIRISEQGFEESHDDDVVLPTQDVIIRFLNAE